MATNMPATTTKAMLLPKPLLNVMQGLMPDVYLLLPPDITEDQFRAACWLEITGRRDLHDCVLESIRDSIIYAANYGLMPGRDCHFLPFKQKRYSGKKGSQCIPNYFGLLRTLDRSGKVRRAFAHPVHEGDEWGFDMFQDRPIHKPAVTLGKKQGKELFYYGAIMFLDGTCAFEILTLEQLEAIRKSAPAHDSGPWVTDPVMMKRKTALKRVAKYVQLTPDLRRILDQDEDRESQDIPNSRHRQNIVDLFGEGSDPSAPIGRDQAKTPLSTEETPAYLIDDDDDIPEPSSEPSMDWRHQLRSLAADVHAQLDGRQPADLAKRVRDLIQRAERLIEDPDAPEGQGKACMEALRKVSEEVVGQMGMKL